MQCFSCCWLTELSHLNLKISGKSIGEEIFLKNLPQFPQKVGHLGLSRDRNLDFEEILNFVAMGCKVLFGELLYIVTSLVVL